MSSIGNFATNIFRKLCENGVADRANFLKNIAVVGWVLSSLAQTCSIIFNDKIPAKEKKFLIPQEIFDGLTNATLFWFITSKATDFGKLLVLKKHVIPKAISETIKTFIPKGNNIAVLKEALFNHVKLFGNPEQLKTAKNAVEGMGVLTGLIGAVISNNIVTPLVRNKLAGICQQKNIIKENSNAPLNPYFGQLDFSKYDFEKLASAPKVATFKGFYPHSNTSGSLKI